MMAAIEPTDWFVVASHVLALCVGLWGGWVITLLRMRGASRADAHAADERAASPTAAHAASGPATAAAGQGQPGSNVGDPADQDGVRRPPA